MRKSVPERKPVEQTQEPEQRMPPVGVGVPIPSAPTAAQREVLLRRYLDHVISRNRYLQLQGIRSGRRLVNIDLDQIYITLKATRTRTVEAEEAWLAEERQFAPGEISKGQRMLRTETVAVKVEEALAEHKHLVVLGDPGSGKTTLLRYLALCYARDHAEDSTIVRDRLGYQKVVSCRFYCHCVISAPILTPTIRRTMAPKDTNGCSRSLGPI
jgi:HrpA-like RNA helicase